MKPISVATRGVLKAGRGLSLAARGFVYPALVPEEVIYEILDWINDHRYEQRWHGQVGVHDLVEDLIEVEVLQVPRWSGQQGAHSAGPVPMISAIIESRRWSGERGTSQPPTSSPVEVSETSRWSGQAGVAPERRASSTASVNSRQRWAGQRASKQPTPPQSEVSVDEN